MNTRVESRIILGAFALVLAVAVCAGIACSGGASRSVAEAPPVPEPRTVDGVPNAVQVGDLLFGGQPTRQALAALGREGYRTVLSTRGSGELKWDERSVVDSLGMNYASIPIAHSSKEITDDEVAEFDDLMKHGERPMVLHCSSGNRVAGLWAVWLVERKGVDPGQALDLAAKAGMTRLRPLVEARLKKDSKE